MVVVVMVVMVVMAMVRVCAERVLCVLCSVCVVVVRGGRGVFDNAKEEGWTLPKYVHIGFGFNNCNDALVHFSSYTRARGEGGRPSERVNTPTLS